ncbi:TPA-induced transmembrane protein [Xiphias gladius]|uniref:TPA-induced transmembrane protein n=1 Tax=Xiphias gladius TaxID=8245 RepID=UPI001A99FB6D|nr:TPA-induced transmembrane protein [Xiphias gladius]
MDTEMQPITRNGSNGTSYSSHERVTAGNGGGVAYTTSEVTEKDGLLAEQVTGSNGETMLSVHAAEAQWNPLESKSACRIKRELNLIVFWRVRLWMLLFFILLVVPALIIVSLALCSAVHEDADEKFDPSLFKVPRYFNGSFQLPHLVLTEELLTPSSNESQALTADLQEKLADIYRSSPALGRYFSKAEIYALRNGSVTADYQLTFLMPEEQQEQLRNFTLSREMVYNVFRQFLYDQEPDNSGPLFIDPLSLNMF